MLSRVKANAKQLEALLPQYQQKGTLPFGVEKHLFQLRPPASPTEVEALEQEYQVRLPSDYRVFLLEVGNGGAGPGYGLTSLSSWGLKAGCWEKTPTFSGPVPRVPHPCASYLASPSPIRPGFRYPWGWLEDEKTWHENGIEWDFFQGTITICYHGCAGTDQLIISGEGRGRVVGTDEDFVPPSFAPYPDFLSWYESWQDAAINDGLGNWNKHLWENRQVQIFPQDHPATFPKRLL